jgi:hypothetical protein
MMSRSAAPKWFGSWMRPSSLNMNAIDRLRSAYVQFRDWFAANVMGVPSTRALFYIICVLLYAVITVVVTVRVSGVLGIAMGATPWIIGCVVTALDILRDRR